MVKWLSNKSGWALCLFAWLAMTELHAQQTDRVLELDPLAVEAVLLPDPVTVPVESEKLKVKSEKLVDSGECRVESQLRVESEETEGDKKDRDEAMTAKIAYGSTESLHPLDPKTLVLHQTNDSLVLRTEGDIFWIEQLSGDLYFSVANDTLQTLWSRDYPAQSMANLLLGQIDQPDFGIDLTHRRYGTEKPRFHVRWASLYNTLCTPGVRCYASGFVRDGGKAVRGVLIVHHPNGNYVHMLVLTTTLDELFAPEGQLKDLHGDLFTNVPQQNILNLYE